MRPLNAARAFAPVLPFLLVACSGGGGGGGGSNDPPTASAGPDGTTLVRRLVELDGTGSSDPEGQALSYAWSFVSRPAGSAAALRDATAAHPTFAADRSGDYVVQLVVSDGRATSAADAVTVSTVNSPPAANAGVDQRSVVGQALALDGGGSSDWEGDALTYAWSIPLRPAGSTAQIVGPSDASPSFMPDVAGEYALELVVADGAHASAPDRMVLSAAAPDAPPELSIDDVSVLEGDAGDAGTTNATLAITISKPSATATTVRWSTADAGATAPGDYLTASGTARIEAGSTRTELVVTVNGDAVAEADESFLVTLSDPAGATIADGEGVAEIADGDPGPPTSFELIAAALAGGFIDEETSLVYQVFAEFGDARLPTAYQGRDDGFFEGVATMDAARRFETLTPATQGVLAPFLEAPDSSAPYLGSAALDPLRRPELSSPLAVPDDTNWTGIELVPGTVFMKWDAEAEHTRSFEAVALKAEFDAVIWPKLKALLGAPFEGARINIYLMNGPGRSEATPADANCSTENIRLYQFHPTVLVHELTHALLDLNFEVAACTNTETMWMNEATATWAQHYVYPPANQGREQAAADWFLSRPHETLSKYEGTPRGREYGAYLWFFRLSGSSPPDRRPVRGTWDDADAAGRTSLEAIEAYLRESGLGGFEEQWPKFALDNWNRHAPDAPTRKYHQWDKLDRKAKEQQLTASLDGAGFRLVSLEYDLPILSADYQRWAFSDPGVRTIVVENPHAENDPTASVQAIVKIKDQPWRVEDLFESSERTYCRDKDDEDVETIVFVVSNRGFRDSDPNIGDGTRVSLFLSALPCADFTGSTNFRSVATIAPGFEAVTVATGAGLRFRVLPDNRALWRPIEGMVNVSFDSREPFEDGSCTGSAATSFTAANHAQVALLPDGDDLAYFGVHLAFLPVPPTIQASYNCTSSSGTFTFTQDVPYFGTDWFFTGTPWPFEPGAAAISGTYTSTSGSVVDTWTWNLLKEGPGRSAGARTPDP